MTRPHRLIPCCLIVSEKLQLTVMTTITEYAMNLITYLNSPAGAEVLRVRDLILIQSGVEIILQI